MASHPRLPTLAYLVSAYPAVSHTFILREIRQLRALGHPIVTASINPADRARDKMDLQERAEAERTYVVKQHGVAGALAALLLWLCRAPWALLGMLAFGLQMRSGGKAWWSGLAYGVEAAMVARWMRREGTRHLHVHFGNAGASVGVLVKRLTGCHLSYTIHGPDEFDDVGGQHLAVKMREADVVVCISQFARGQLMRITDPAHWDKFRVCHLGVEPEQFRFALRDAGALPQLLCVGRLTPAKGQILLIRALAALARSGACFHLTLVGAGPDRARIEAEISACDLAHAVTLTGALTQDEVRRRFARADIFVLPSLAEGIPVVLMEAMSCGVPCISTPVNGIPELVLHGQTGLLATPGDVASLAARLRQLIDQPALRHQLALAARDKVLQDFDLARNVAALASIFRAFPRMA
jgi:colanic acid/amylovoran biosynthesis glycosyltransferase